VPDLRAVPSLTYSGARTALDAAVAGCEERGWAFCIAVVDAAGHPLATARMDGAPLLSVGIAANKASTVTAFNGLPTADCGRSSAATRPWPRDCRTPRTWWCSAAACR
jgi:glc operon protein GlcG